MKKLKLNENFGKTVITHGYELDPTEQYCFCLEDEFEQQQSIASAVMTMGLPALNDYHKWLKDNGFNVDMPNPTNNFVEPYFGAKPLWTTDLSQGIVVKDENDDDYYIVMECSRLNTGFKYTQIILTLGGCI
ncbi:hypothetical protein [Oscillibacter sp.]|uniref:hypothetical protein n=1 Tax=Oscillibacter sp. TaxID=1945593 RepID=UPI0028A00565|nr:hypothetical protein [Oscillibacter sp.]